MKCPECQKEGLKSSVYEGAGMTTCMGWVPYYDEDGNYHSHNPNKHMMDFSCSKGHEWSTAYQSTCSSCDYGREKEA